MKTYSLWVAPRATPGKTQNFHTNKRVVVRDTASPAKMNQFVISETPIKGESETKKWKNKTKNTNKPKKILKKKKSCSSRFRKVIEKFNQKIVWEIK